MTETTRRDLNRCRQCGKKFSNPDDAKWHFWAEHRRFIYRRVMYVALIGAAIGVALLVLVEQSGGL